MPQGSSQEDVLTDKEAERRTSAEVMERGRMHESYVSDWEGVGKVRQPAREGE